MNFKPQLLRPYVFLCIPYYSCLLLNVPFIVKFAICAVSPLSSAPDIHNLQDANSDLLRMNESTAVNTPTVKYTPKRQIQFDISSFSHYVLGDLT